MSAPRLQTRFSQPGQPGPEFQAQQPRTYSWVQTPVEMRHQQYATPESIPPLPAIPDALRRAPEPTTTYTAPASVRYQPDLKTDLGNVGPHPSQYTPYTDATPTDQAPQPLTHWRTTPIPPSPGHTPPKADLGSTHEASVPVHIAPDENPLTPTTPNQPFDKVKLTTHPPSVAADSGTGYINHYPGQAPDPIQQIKGGTWNHGLCDCGDVGTCCTGLFCPCILYGKTQYRLTQKSERKDPTNMLGYETLNGSCAVFAVLCGCNWILASIQHTRIRKAYDIPGSVGSDCIRGLCCSCCTLAQDEKEIKYRESHKAGLAGSAANNPYATPVGMNYAPPPK